MGLQRNLKMNCLVLMMNFLAIVFRVVDICSKSFVAQNRQWHGAPNELLDVQIYLTYLLRYNWSGILDIFPWIYLTYLFWYIWHICPDIFDTSFPYMYVAHKFVPCHSMGVAEIGDIKEMALRQKFELFIFQQAPQRPWTFMTHIETFI